MGNLNRSVMGVLACLLCMAGAQADDHALAKVAEGYWVTPNFSSIVRVYTCAQSSLCAELAWMYEVGVEGKRMLDEKNPDERLRDKSLIGLSLFTDMSLEEGRWAGRIYNPADGRQYRASITQANKNRLRLRGCWGPFCKRQTWRRLSTVKMPGEAELERQRR